MIDLYNFQIGFRAAIYRLYRYSTPTRALDLVNGCRGFTSKYTLYTFLITTGAEILPNYLTVPVVWLVARQFAVITAAH